jgi:hypothetical protein
MLAIGRTRGWEKKVLTIRETFKLGYHRQYKREIFGLGTRSIPIKMVNDFTVALSSIVHGMITMACKRDTWVCVQDVTQREREQQSRDEFKLAIVEYC